MKTKLKNNKKSAIQLLFIIVSVIVFGITNVYAQVKEEDAKKEESHPQTKEVIEKEIRYPNKLTAKQVPNNNQNNSMDSSGKQVNINKGVASEASKARASVVENKDNANKDYPIHHNDDKDKKETDKYSADARQFITFQTKSGKTFHLIINHDEQSENVMLLTEVSEDDLLNMVEIKEKPKEEIKKIEEHHPESEIKKEELKKEAPKKEEKKGNGWYLFVGIIIVAVIGAGYYFKVYKKKQKSEEEDEEEYDEFEDDYEEQEEVEDTDEIVEEQEEKDIEDMAIDGYEEEE